MDETKVETSPETPGAKADAGAPTTIFEHADQVLEASGLQATVSPELLVIAPPTPGGEPVAGTSHDEPAAGAGPAEQVAPAVVEPMPPVQSATPAVEEPAVAVPVAEAPVPPVAPQEEPKADASPPPSAPTIEAIWSEPLDEETLTAEDRAKVEAAKKSEETVSSPELRKALGLDGHEDDDEETSAPPPPADVPAAEVEPEAPVEPVYIAQCNVRAGERVFGPGDVVLGMLDHEIEFALKQRYIVRKE